MVKLNRVNKDKALEMIKEIDAAVENNGPTCPLSLVKLGRYYYDTTNVPEKDVLEFVNEWQRRQINKPEFGATRI